MLLLVFLGFSWIFNGLSRPASLSTNFPLSGPSTHFQQTTFAVSSFQLAQMVFNWFVGSFNRLCWQFVFNRFSTGRQTGFQRVVIGWQWSFHAMAIVARKRQQAATFSSTLAQLRPRSPRAGR